MTATSRLVLISAVGLLAVTALSGCAGGSSSAPPTVASAATASPRPTPSSTPSAVPIVAGSLVVSASGLQVESTAGGVMADIPFTAEAGAAVAQLTAALGATPSVSSVAESDCVPAASTYDWGAFKVAVPSFGFTHRGSSLAIEVTAARTAAGVSVVFAGRHGVGTPIATVIADAPDTRDSLASNLNWYLVDPQQDGANPWGVRLTTDSSGTVTAFQAPTYYVYPAGC